MARSAVEISSPVALVLCGGSSRGALEVGLYRAVRELGLPVDLVIGSSIGALNGACIAAGMSPLALATLWRGMQRRDAIRWNWKGLLQPYRYPGLYTLDPLRDLLRRTLPETRFERLALPFTVATTDLQGACPAYWSGSGDIIEPILASMSLPVAFPPVEIGGRQFVDGGFANNVPLDRAVELGAREALLISCVCCPPRSKPYRGVVDVLARSLTIAMDRKYGADFAHFADKVRIHAVQPRFERDIGLLDFRYSAELIKDGYRASLAYFRDLNAAALAKAHAVRAVTR